MGELAVDRFDHREGRSADAHGAGHVLRGEARERVEETLPARLPAFDQRSVGIPLVKGEFAVAMAVGGFLGRGGKGYPPRAHAAGHMLQEHADAVRLFVKGGEEVGVGDLSHRPLSKGFQRAKLADSIVQVEPCESIVHCEPPVDLIGICWLIHREASRLRLQRRGRNCP